MRLSLELHWNFLKNRLKVLVGFCIISFKNTDNFRERVLKVRSDQFECFIVVVKAVSPPHDLSVFTVIRSDLWTC